MRIEHTVHMELKAKYEKLLEFTKWCSGVILYPEDYEIPPYEKANEVLRRIGE